MAGSTQLFGTTEFQWTDGGAQTHTLAIPLQGLRPVMRLRRRVRESLDYSNIEFFTYGSTFEVIVEIRYDETPEDLLRLLLAGGKGLTITFDDDTTTWPCYMIFDSFGDLDITPDFDAAGRILGEYRYTIRLRRTDNAAFTQNFFDQLRY